MGSQEECLFLTSPFPNLMDRWGKLYPELEFRMEGWENPLRLHRSTLGPASPMLLGIFDEGPRSPYIEYCNENGMYSLVWKFPKATSDVTYRCCLEKWLRFCYGEHQNFSVDECPHALAALNHLRLSCMADMRNRIEEFMKNIASKDPKSGAKMLDVCAVFYEGNDENGMTVIGRELAKVVLTSKNLESFYDDVVEKCLMKLPYEYLDYVEFKEKHGEKSEFAIRGKYVSKHPELGEPDKVKIMRKCDVFALNNAELRGMKDLKVITSLDETLKICEALERSRDELQAKLDSIMNQVKVWETKKQVDLEATIMLGVCLLHGFVTDQNKEKGVELLTWATNYGNAHAAYCLSKYNNSLDLCLLASQMGNSAAMVELGLRYEEGNGVEKSEQKAVESFKNGADLGNADALFHYGRCFDLGIGGLSKDKAKAFEHYKIAAEKGNSAAMNSLGVCYDKGSGTQPDLGQAFEQFKKGSELGNPDAIYHLAICYDKGRGTAQDTKEAFKLYQRAAALGHAAAMYNVGRCFESGIGTDRDQNKAIDAFKNATDLGNGDAMNALGKINETGVGLPKNLEVAKQLYLKANTKKNSDSMVNLGLLYKFEKAKPKNILEPVEKAKKAHESAKKAEANALKEEAELAKKKDLPENEKKKAEDDVKKKVQDSKAKVEEAKKKLSEAEAKALCDTEKVVYKLFEDASNMGNPNGMYCLAVCLQSGYGITKPNNVDAIKWYRKAADKGHADALFTVGMNDLLSAEEDTRNKAMDCIKRAAQLGSSAAKEYISKLSGFKEPFM